VKPDDFAHAPVGDATKGLEHLEVLGDAKASLEYARHRAIVLTPPKTFGRGFAECSSVGTAVTGVDRMIEHQWRPELGLTTTSLCLANKGLGYNPSSAVEFPYAGK
jgi:hypothetical protein